MNLQGKICETTRFQFKSYEGKQRYGQIRCRIKQTGRNLYLFAPVAFVMKVTALHLWSIFTPKSGANAKEREGRMHFGVAQRFAALIAGVRQMSLKLSAKACRGIASQCPGVCRFAARDCLAVSGGMQVCSAGLPRSVRGHADLWRGIASQCQGVCRFAARDGFGTWGGFVLCTARRR